MAAGFKYIFNTCFRTVEPLEYYRRFLKENCRPDGRELGEFRTTTVNIGSISTADGSALVKLGNTTVICGVKAEFAAPPTDAPDKGYVARAFKTIFLICNLPVRMEIPSTSVAPLREMDMFVICQLGNQKPAFTKPVHFLLVFYLKKLAWVLYCDLICLDYDGNILDACTFALLAALKNALCFIVDPTGEEEHLATGTLTIVMDEEGKLCCLHKPGGSGLTGAKLQDCMSRAVTRHKEVKKLMDEVIKSMKPK
ncbi:hypothetical protein H8959_013747 [Pygathrix nigripes]